MGGRDDLGPRGVDARMNGEGGRIDGSIALDHRSFVIHENQVGYAYMPEVQAKRVHPKMILPHWVARGDVAGHALVEAKEGEESKGGGQTPLAMESLLLE